MRLTVSDGQLTSTDDVDVTTVNVAPVANAGPDQTVHEGDLVRLDGSASSDANGNQLSYRWSFLARPQGSSAQLSSATVVNPTFTADVDGVYTLQLIVNDTIVDSPARYRCHHGALEPRHAGAREHAAGRGGAQAGVRVLLPFDAPAGGVTVSLASSNPRSSQRCRLRA